MAISLKHKFQSAKSDGGDASLVRPSNWNDEHDITLAASRLLGRHSGTGGAAQEISLGSGLTFNSGVLDIDFTVLSAKAAPFVGADRVLLMDSAAGNALKYVSLTDLWAQAKWRTFPIGGWYMVDTSKAGVEVPPITDTDSVWVKLTAGLTGAGLFNNGKLTTETISGSGPTMTATAVVNVSGSPINGQTIQLLNTESRVLRPSTSPGAVQNDQFQGFRLGASGGSRITLGLLQITGGATPAPFTSGSDYFVPADDGTNGTPRTGTETRMKNLGVEAFMRVK